MKHNEEKDQQNIELKNAKVGIKYRGTHEECH